ncbi:MAG: hypothetical protein LBI94_07085 [Treponema sp.]|nr:hypothetical protein [Treponema sp.]
MPVQLPLILIVLFFLLFVSCAGVPEQTRIEAPPPPVEVSTPHLEEIYDSGYWVTRPSAAGITVIGIAGRRANRDEAIREAQADAARKAALYHGVRGESFSILSQGSGTLDYFSDFEYQLDLLNNADQYAGELVFDKDSDVLEKNGLVFVSFQYPGVFDIPAYETPLEDGVPAWVKQYNADIPGFLTSVGLARNKGTHQKTYQASYENAIASLLPRLSSKVSSEVIDAAGNRRNQNILTGSGVLDKVMILESWLDKKTNSVWTLLVAKQKL